MAPITMPARCLCPYCGDGFRSLQACRDHCRAKHPAKRKTILKA